MAIRFRKTVSFGKFLRVNVGKNGLSTSVGPRGASVSVGKRGVHANVSAPGTGLSIHQRLDGHSAKEAASQAAGDVRDTASNRKQVLWIVLGIVGTFLIGILKAALKNK